VWSKDRILNINLSRKIATATEWKLLLFIYNSFFMFTVKIQKSNTFVNSGLNWVVQMWHLQHQKIIEIFIFIILFSRVKETRKLKKKFWLFFLLILYNIKAKITQNVLIFKEIYRRIHGPLERILFWKLENWCVGSYKMRMCLRTTRNRPRFTPLFVNVLL
jgi:hypothetical protein